jgi:hypothetical protein
MQLSLSRYCEPRSQSACDLAATVDSKPSLALARNPGGTPRATIRRSSLAMMRLQKPAAAK